MPLFPRKEKSPLYHAANGLLNVDNESTEDIRRWAADANCIEREQWADVLAKRLARAEALRLEQDRRYTEKRAILEENPFDPRTEVSADAQHVARQVVKHLWIIFVALPFVLGILYATLK